MNKLELESYGCIYSIISQKWVTVCAGFIIYIYLFIYKLVYDNRTLGSVREYIHGFFKDTFFMILSGNIYCPYLYFIFPFSYIISVGELLSIS